MSLAQTDNDKKIDSFLRQEFDFLDNQLKFYSTANSDSIDSRNKNFQSALDKEANTVDFFERLTGIKTEIHHGDVYTKFLTQSTVELWKEWTKKNKNLITWDNLQNKVNRTDRDIYSRDIRSNN